jgi:hypothetical protein
MSNIEQATPTQLRGSVTTKEPELHAYKTITTTPGQIIEELQRLQTEMQRGSDALYDAEIKLADAEAVYDRAVSLSFLNSQGTVADRQAVAKLQAVEEKLKVDLARAEYNRIKMKMKTLSDQATMTAVISKNVELQWRG